ncbi:MAG: hypothetical protein ABIR91_04500 [Candidatus Saccharimonadales bacterium]
MKREIYGDSMDEPGEIVYQKSIEDNHWDREGALKEPLPIEDVLATQALVMKLLRQHDRSVLIGDKRYCFAVLNDINSDRHEAFDGSLEEYVACRVAKVDYGEWRMRVRFRQNELRQETKARSFVEDYSFMWLRSGQVMAEYGTYKVRNTPGGTYEEWRDVRPIDTGMIAGLHDRLRQHTS